MGKKVMLALSGGVDSAVAADLLLEEGYEVHGVTMKLQQDGFEEPVASAREVAEFLGISHTVLDLTQAFERDVVHPWLDAYRQGQTPNPCQFCNPAIKYGLLLDWAMEQGADFFATGHYAKLKRDPNGRVHLIQAENERKDQGYVLCRLSQAQLQRLLFPVGEFASKEEVRAYAKRRGIPVFEKKDSMGICFIPGGDHLTYLAKHAPSVMMPGPVRDQKGKILGRHQGLARFTIGQKKGLQKWTGGKEFVVTRLDAKDKALWLGPEEALWTERVMIEDLQWIVPQPMGAKLEVKLCQWGPKVGAKEVESQMIRLVEPARAPAPGQVVAIYQGREVIGSAIIKG